MYHYRKTRQAYGKLNRADKKTAGCPFPSCNENSHQKTIYENKTMYIIANRIAYDVFEGRSVTDHLMIIPKRHVETMGEFTDQEKLDQMTIAGEYEARGYNIYARGIGNISRSVDHQHTHLIKTSDKKSSVMVFTEKPYCLINF